MTRFNINTIPMIDAQAQQPDNSSTIVLARGIYGKGEYAGNTWIGLASYIPELGDRWAWVLIEGNLSADIRNITITGWTLIEEKPAER